MTGLRLTVAVAFSLALANAGLAQLHPIAFADADAAGMQMQMDMSGSADEGIPSVSRVCPETAVSLNGRSETISRCVEPQCVRAGGENQACPLPAAVLLLLRPP